MTPADYRAALSTLGLSIEQAGEWLGVSRRTAYNYASEGPSAPAARAIQLLLSLSAEDREKALR